MFEDLLRRLRFDVTGLADALQTLLASPIPRGKLVSVVLPSGEATLDIKHGLRRAANGALVVSVSDTGNAYVIAPVTSETLITLQAIGGFAPASDVRLKLWVF